MHSKIINCISTIDSFNKDLYSKLGLGVEIQDFTNPNLLDNGYEEIAEKYSILLKNFPNTISLHGPFLDLKPISPDKTIRDASINRYLQAINIGSNLNADYIIFHSQINPYLNEPNIKKINNNLNKEFWQKILNQASYFKGTILIENIFENDPLMLKELIDTINLPNVKICLDIGHAILSNDIHNWVEILKDDIVYIHFHWNNGIYDEHMMPSNENILYLKKVLDKFNLNPHIALEYEVNNVTDEIKKYKIF